MNDLTERFLRVEAVFHEAVELQGDARERLIESRCREDRALIAEVNLLLDACETEAHVSETVRLKLESGLENRPDRKRAGPYELDRLVGRGGMAAVYLAHRVDGHFEQQVAIKLIDLPLATDVFRERFRQERQILAGLQHPYIARLLDGGVTPEGDLFLAMEYVHGIPIHRFCEEKGLTAPQRIALFLQVCEAVQFAHEHFIVHRDLKPDNILVAEDGTPRLLDFGTAKLLSPSLATPTSELTREGYRSFTPQYASPEQVLGNPISTASDTYSLGVLLYVLLTGAPPYELKELTTAEMLRVVCEEPPKRPAHAVNSQKRLDSDLEAILMKALRKESRERYLTADQLACDLRAYSGGQPVAAHQGTIRYRAEKFTRRHWFGISAAAMLASTLAAGAVGIVWQAKVANQERRKAEARSADLRQLSNSLLSELDEAIKQLPGSTGAQKLLVTRVLDHLDRMGADASDDRQTQLDLANAYVQIGQVQGDPYFQNMGDISGALADFDKAITIAQSLSASNRSDREALHTSALALRSRSETLFRVGRTPEAVPLIRQATSTFDILTTDPNVSAAILAEAANAYGVMGDEFGQPLTESLNDESNAIAAYRKDLSLVLRAQQRDPSEPQTHRVAAVAAMRIGEIEMDADPVQAIHDLDLSLQFLDTMPKTEQTNFGPARVRSAVLHRKAISLNELGRYDEAARLFRDVYQSDLERQNADPLDVRLLEDLIGDLNDEATGYEYAATPALARVTADRRRNLNMAASLYAQAVPFAERFLRREPANEDLQETLSELELHLNSLHAQLHSDNEDDVQARKQLNILRRLARDDAAPAMLYAVADAYLQVEPPSLRDPRFALNRAQRAVERSFGKTAAMQLTLAQAYRAVGQITRCRQEARIGLALLPAQRINEPAPRLRKLLDIAANAVQ
ncbi:MAG: serine/threonine-protein kinase [Terracidiphilus sp.]